MSNTASPTPSSNDQPKFGSNHAKAMLYQGLAELGNALTTDSNITQRHLEHGIYGLGDPPGKSEAPEPTQGAEQPSAPSTPATSAPSTTSPASSPTAPSAPTPTPIVDGHVHDAQAQARATRDRSTRESPVIEAPAPPSIELERE